MYDGHISASIYNDNVKNVTLTNQYLQVLIIITTSENHTICNENIPSHLISLIKGGSKLVKACCKAVKEVKACVDPERGIVDHMVHIAQYRWSL